METDVEKLGVESGRGEEKTGDRFWVGPSSQWSCVACARIGLRGVGGSFDIDENRMGGKEYSDWTGRSGYRDRRYEEEDKRKKGRRGDRKQCLLRCSFHYQRLTLQTVDFHLCGLRRNHLKTARTSNLE